MIISLEKKAHDPGSIKGPAKIEYQATATLKQVGVAGLIPQPIHYLENIVNTLQLHYCNYREGCRKMSFSAPNGILLNSLPSFVALVASSISATKYCMFVTMRMISKAPSKAGSITDDSVNFLFH